ncbi:glyoxalase superfamily protein [Streptomyces sp. NPDC055078]
MGDTDSAITGGIDSDSATRGGIDSDSDSAARGGSDSDSDSAARGGIDSDSDSAARGGIDSDSDSATRGGTDSDSDSATRGGTDPVPLWAIGRFAATTGLTISTLRHYDSVGLLRPAWVDPGTGYRYYRPVQVATAEVILRLRAAGMSVDETRAALDADDETVRDLLRAHRDRLVQDADVVAERVEHTDRYIREGLMTSTDSIPFHKIIPTLPVRDVDTSVRFYVSSLGFTLGGRSDDDFASVFRGRVADVNIYLRHRADSFGGAECFVFVEDPDALHSEYAERGVEIAERPHDTSWGYRQFTVLDPDGHELHLFRFLAE